MKKLKISMLALLFTIGIGTAVVQKIHATPKHHLHKTTDLYWYNVVSGKTSGTEIFEGTKADALGQTSCDDSETPVCLYGSTNGSLANGTPIGNPPADDRILHQ